MLGNISDTMYRDKLPWNKKYQVSSTWYIYAKYRYQYRWYIRGMPVS